MFLYKQLFVVKLLQRQSKDTCAMRMLLLLLYYTHLTRRFGKVITDPYHWHSDKGKEHRYRNNWKRPQITTTNTSGFRDEPIVENSARDFTRIF